MGIFRVEGHLLQRMGPQQGSWWLILAIVLGLMAAWLPLPVAGGIIGGTAVLLLIVIRPLWGIGLALLLGPWGALERFIWGGSLLDSGQLLLMLSLLAWLAARARERRLVLPRIGLMVPLLLFLFVTSLSLVTAPSLTFGLKEVVKWVEIGMIMLMVVDLGQEREFGEYGVLGMLLLAGFSQAAVGIWQFGLRDTGPEHFAILGRFYRAYGSFEQPNPFGGFMNLTALLALGATIGLVTVRWQRRGQATTVWAWLWLAFVAGCALATTLALIMSWSRGAWLGFLAGTAVLPLLWPRRWWVGAGLSLLLLVGFLGTWQLGLVPASVSGRITSFGEDLRFGDVRGVDINDANYAVLERLAHWQAALEMARDGVWLGVGFGNYEPAYADYALINWPYPLGHAHNYYLNLLAEVGVLGFVTYLIFWTAVIGQTLALIRRTQWPQRGIALGLMAAWVALSVHHFVDKLYVNNIYIHLGVMLGLLQLLRSKRHAAERINALEGFK